MSPFLHDVRLACRRLRNQLGFTAVAVLTLGLALGANIAVFTLVHALILRSLPVERPGELYRLGNTNDCCVNSGLAGSYSLFSWPLFQQLKADTPELADLAAFQATTVSMGLRRSGEPAATAMPGAFVTGNYFAMFGVRPAAGRLLRAEDDAAGAAPVAVMAWWAWTQYFARDPSVIGNVFIVNGAPVTVVGVSAPSFFGDTVRPDPAALWIPIAQEKGIRGPASTVDRPDQNWLYAIGRLTPGMPPERVSARATASLQRWLSEQSFLTDADERAHIPRQHIVVTPAGGGVGAARDQYSRSLALLFGASALVLLIGAANLANLLLARADRGQAAIRAALGASSGWLIQQALTEGIVLATAGGLAGVVIAIVSTQALLRIVFPLAAFVPVDATPPFAVWLFALILAIGTGALFAAAPAWAMARTPPLDALAGTGRSASARSFVPRGALVVVQVTLSLVLLSTAGLLATSLENLEHQPLGFTPANRLVIRIDPPAIAGQIDRLSSLYARLDEHLRRVPGVERVAAAMYSPMEDNNWSFRVSVSGRRADESPDFSSWNRVTAGYFATVGTRVLRGRAIDERDTPGARRVAVVNESFAARFFERRDPIGETLGLGDPGHASDYEIVGVVEDAKYTGATRSEVRPMLFLPSFQIAPYTSEGMRAVQARSTLLRALVVQVSPSAANLEARIRAAIVAADPNITVIRMLTMDTQVSANFRLQRLMSRLSTVYGALALTLASLGLYGVTAYGVSRRTREIGVRMALGADRRRVILLCVRRPLLQAAIGLGLGLPAALGAGRAIGTQLYGVGGLDPAIFATAIVVLALSAIAAAALPARRAASVDPSTALRTE
jgi:predicted permease